VPFGTGRLFDAVYKLSFSAGEKSMKRIGSFDLFEAASKQSVRGTPPEAPPAQHRPHPITTVEDLELLIPGLPPPAARLFLGIAKAFDVDPQDHAGLRALFESFKRPDEFRDALNSHRDKNGRRPLHNAVLQGDEILVVLLCRSGADPSEMISDGSFRGRVDRELGIRNKQSAVANPHAGRNALTLTIADGIKFQTHYLARQLVNGQRLVNIRDGLGDTAVCLAIEHANDIEACGLIAHEPEAGWLANGAGTLPLELAIERGRIKALDALLEYSYAKALVQPDFEAARQGCCQDLEKATHLVASCWAGLRDREAILACLLQERQDFRPLGPGNEWVLVPVFPVKHCVNVLFDQACTLIGSGPDTYALFEQRRADPSAVQRDYSMMQVLLGTQAHLQLDDQGDSIGAYAKQQQNEVLLDLCRQAGILPRSTSESGQRDQEEMDIAADSNSDG
jgi:ankyrin repeat protein